jgi:hypothetical protein
VTARVTPQVSGILHGLSTLAEQTPQDLGRSDRLQRSEDGAQGAAGRNVGACPRLSTMAEDCMTFLSTTCGLLTGAVNPLGAQLRPVLIPRRDVRNRQSDAHLHLGHDQAHDD